MPARRTTGAGLGGRLCQTSHLHFQIHRGRLKLSDDPAKMKEELLRLLAGVEPEAQKLEQLAQEAAQAARFARDCAKPLSVMVAQVSENQLCPEEWGRQNAAWQDWHQTIRLLHGTATTVNSFGAQCYGATNTTASGFMPVFFGSPPKAPPPPVVEAARNELFLTLDRHPLADKAQASMHRLGLKSRGGDKRPATDLLAEARATMERPSVGEGRPTSVLVTLRECIDAAITELVRRRPKQEETKGWAGKVASVGHQCQRPGLPPDYFDRLGIDADRLMDELSKAKQIHMDRVLVTEVFKRGLLFLNALMDGIDETLLRP